jgi:uncharacterized protein
VRPEKPRRIRGGPIRSDRFKPQGIPMRDLDEISLSLDGFEALRLADVDGLYQDAAADSMGVSRATFGRILTAARHTVATAVVEGRVLVIEGGVVKQVSPEEREPDHHHRRRRRRGCGRGCHGNSEDN